ncbi:TPA: hypothetical protein ACGU2T_004501 [Vibrio vulnificus]|uniref:hypothetical protein n=1 Tax=Vibrio parahaemolyticus TaxID=670 RepID=UPI000946B74A|nr:hypothetical protein [Vibrio parahaemolyticus]OLF42341.1 hypothetical protein BUQ66_23855 [Vibrio parahaemolyticus]HCM1082078.1 hypothetical protein [Vibrio parahaemolyticus]
MGYTKDNWKARIAQRSDITCGLIHLTRDNGSNGILQVLLKILKEQKLIGSTTESGFIVGNTPAVCFQEAPLYSVAQNIYTEQEYRKQNSSAKVRYYGCGIQIEKQCVFQSGGRPVIYEKTCIAKKMLPDSEYWRIVNFDLANDTSVIDWTHEREWRVPGDFEFNLGDITVLLPNEGVYREFLKLCFNHDDLSHIPTSIKGITHMGSVFY